MRYSDLKQKEVINICDGKKLGTIVDLDLDVERGTILAIVVPTPFSISAVFRGEPTGNVIPWGAVVKIGDDAVLVQVDGIWPVHPGA